MKLEGGVEVVKPVSENNYHYFTPCSASGYFNNKYNGVQVGGSYKLSFSVLPRTKMMLRHLMKHIALAV